MAKASNKDMDASIKLCGLIDSLYHGYLPDIDDDGEPELFDEYDDAQCAKALRQLMSIADSGSLPRVVWGMHTLLSPANKLLDPDSDTLERHPDIIAALDAVAANRLKQSGEIEMLKALAIECRSSVKLDLANYDRVIEEMVRSHQQNSATYDAVSKERERLFSLINRIDSLMRAPQRI